MSPSQVSVRPAAHRGSARLLVRMHFYAGLFVSPFLLVAAVTGLLYTVAPQIDRIAYGDLLTSPSGPVTPLSEQVMAAQRLRPDLAVSAIEVTQPGGSTHVTFSDPALRDSRERTVYVDPTDSAVKGSLVTWFGATPAVTWLDDLHRNLHLGALGRHYSEIAASWLAVLGLGGALLWLRRRRDSRRVHRTLLPELSARGRRRVLSWHGSTGLALTVALLFLSATGLTWSRFAGEHFSDALSAVHASTPELDTALPGGRANSVDLADSDRVLQAGRASGLDGPLSLTPSASGAWSVTQTDETWPIRRDSVAVDAVTGQVTSHNRWADRPALSQLSSLGISAHMGVLFGWVSQVLLAAVALGVLCVIFWGYRAWWQRRPRLAAGLRRSVGKPPARGAWRDLHPGAVVGGVAATAAVGWAIPWLGVSLLGFLIVDALVGLAARATGAGRATADPVSGDDRTEELLV